MKPIDDDILQAYVDGELDASASASIDAALDQDALLAQRVQQARAVRTELKAAFDPVLEEPVPAHLTALLKPPAPPATISVAALATARRRPGSGTDRHRLRRRWFVPAAAVAASIAVLSVAIFWRGNGDLVRVQDNRQFAAGALSRALDQALASEPEQGAPISVGLTFRSADGQICRTFVAHAKPAMAGLACHGQTGWALPAYSTVSEPASGGLRQASSGLPPEVQAAVDARIRGDAFDAQQERAARDSGWR